MGRNGAGKSTLLKLLVEELKPSDGLVSRKSKLGVSMFSQHHVDQLELSKTPLEEMKGLLDLGDGRDDVQTCRQRCASPPFPRIPRLPGGVWAESFSVWQQDWRVRHHGGARDEPHRGAFRRPEGSRAVCQGLRAPAAHPRARRAHQPPR